MSLVESTDLPTWLPLNEAFKITIAHFGDREKANYELLKALREDKIRNGGIMEDWSDKIVYRKIHLNTDDLMRWLNTVFPKNKPH